MTTLLVVDDEPLIRSGLRGALSQFDDIDIVAETGTGDEGIAAATRLHPDVVLMDVRMPGRDGLSATEILCSDSTFTGAVLVLTTFESDDYVFRAMHRGARGFFLKRWPIATIADAIRVAATGESVIFPDSLARIIAEHGSAPRRSTGLVEDLLTLREQVVLAQMAAGRNNAEAAAALTVTVETVKSQVSSILLKLGVRDRTQAVIRAFETGFVTAESGQPSHEGTPTR